jgi:hypothetical protein
LISMVRRAVVKASAPRRARRRRQTYRPAYREQDIVAEATDARYSAPMPPIEHIVAAVPLEAIVTRASVQNVITPRPTIATRPHRSGGDPASASATVVTPSKRHPGEQGRSRR